VNILLLFLQLALAAPTSLETLSGTDLVTGKNLSFALGDESATHVLVFLSSTCPCSNAHIDHLKLLGDEFKQVRFVGLHANSDESSAQARPYFEEKKLNFPVLSDPKAQWADRLKASKTPHAFVISKGSVVYQGGVSSSSDPARADHFYLKKVLASLASGAELEWTQTRVLGCEISR